MTSGKEKQRVMGDGARLKEVLKEKNTNVRRLAAETGISATTLYSAIKKDTNIKMYNGIRIASALRVPLSSICSEVPPESNAYGVAEKALQPKKESNALADVYLEMLLEQIAYLYTLMRIYGKIDEEKEPITTAVANALVLGYARLS